MAEFLSAPSRRQHFLGRNSTVGHDGATAYIASMALRGVSWMFRSLMPWRVVRREAQEASRSQRQANAIVED
jgi:hypothetical protein